MKGYWLVLGTEVSDQEAQSEYGRLWTSIADKYQARVKNPQDVLLLKEAREANRVILVEFPSYELAQACYEDPIYVEAREIALRAFKRVLFILKGDFG